MPFQSGAGLPLACILFPPRTASLCAGVHTAHCVDRIGTRDAAIEIDGGGQTLAESHRPKAQGAAVVRGVPARRNEVHWRASTVFSDAAPLRFIGGRREMSAGTVPLIVLVLRGGHCCRIQLRSDPDLTDGLRSSIKQNPQCLLGFCSFSDRLR